MKEPWDKAREKNMGGKVLDNGVKPAVASNMGDHKFAFHSLEGFAKHIQQGIKGDPAVNVAKQQHVEQKKQTELLKKSQRSLDKIAARRPVATFG
jgi:hypothetical protein